MALKKKREEVLPKPNPLQRPDYIDAELWALRACWRGEANAAQQKLAIDTIIRVAGTYDMPYRPASSRDTDFALGMMHVGQTLVWLLKVAPSKVDPDKVAARAAGSEKTDV